MDVFFVDCGIIYCGLVIMMIIGLLYFEGCMVFVLVDGDYVCGLIVVGGVVILFFVVLVVYVGLFYVVEFEMLLFVIQFDDVGVVCGRLYNVSGVKLQMEKICGIKIVMQDGCSNEIVQMGGDLVEEIVLWIGIYNLSVLMLWNKDGMVMIWQDYLLFMIILGIFVDLLIGCF